MLKELDTCGGAASTVEIIIMAKIDKIYFSK